MHFTTQLRKFVVLIRVNGIKATIAGVAPALALTSTVDGKWIAGRTRPRGNTTGRAKEHAT